MRSSLVVVCLILLFGAAQPVRAQAQAAPVAGGQVAQPSAPPTAAPTGYPAQQVYAQPVPQQVYPQQVYPQQVYPQQAPPSYAQRGYVAPPRLTSRPPRPRKGIMIAGISLLSATYAIGLITGAALVDTKCCERAGWALFIPVGGPFRAAQLVDHGRGALALLGTAQVVGAVLTIGGIVQYVRTGRAAQAAYALALPRGKSLNLDLQTSPYLTGPTLKLAF